MGKERICCKELCIHWNSDDEECELFGENHSCPRECTAFINGQCIEDNIPHKESTVLFIDEEKICGDILD